MILAEGLEKRFGATRALRGFSLEAPPASVFGLIGQNGAGKTTAIRVLATLLRPDAGRFVLAGVDGLARPREARRLLGYVPDFFGIYENIRAGEYLDFFAAAYGIRGPRARRLRDDLLELVGLSHKRDDPVNGLSRGMQQRLCLARALVHDPAVLLLDEPASGLDPIARLELREVLKELRALGKTILVSSHILPELADFCTHVGFVVQGEAVWQGTIRDAGLRSRERRLVLRVLGPEAAGRAAALLEGLERVRLVSAEGEEVQFAFSGELEEIPALLAALVREGVPVVSFTEAARGLEDVLMRLTRGGEGA